MKTRYYHIILLLGILLLLYTSCRKNRYQEHEHFGKVPAVFNEYQQKKDGLRSESKMSASIGRSLEMKSEIKKLDKKYRNRFREEYQKLKLPVYMPVEGNPDYKNHSIKEVYISEIKPDGIVKLSAKSIAKKDSSFLIAYAYFANAEHKPVCSDPYVLLTLPAAHRGEIALESIKTGNSIELEGYCHYLGSLADAERIILVSEEEYYNLKN